MRNTRPWHILAAGLVAIAGLPLLTPAPGHAASSPLQEAPTARFSGQIQGQVVTSDTGVPVPGATVEAPALGLFRVTDQQGRFTLIGLPETSAEGAGQVLLVVRRVGFEPGQISVVLSDDRTTRVEIALQRMVVGLDPISVLQGRIRMVGDAVDGWTAPGSAFHLSRRDLEAQKLAFDNVHDILRQVPGVQVQDEEGYGLRPNIGLRGTGVERSSNITLMEDGVLIAPAPYSAPAAYYFPTMARMDGVEVRKGASQIRYGPRTLGGAINLLSATIPERREWLLDVAGGEESMLRAHARLGESRANVGWIVEGFTMRTDGFKELQGGGGTGFDTRDFVGKLRLNTDRAEPRYQELEIKLGYTDHESDETYLGLTDADFLLTPNLRYAASREDLMDTEHRQVQARYFVQPTQRTDVVVTAYRNTFARNWYKLQSVSGASLAAVLGSPEAYADELAILRGEDSTDGALRVRANNREYLSRGVQATLGLRLGDLGSVTHGLEFGLRYHYDNEDRLQWEDGYRMTQGRMILTSEGAPGTQANRLSEASALALYLQDEIRYGRWIFVPGLRYESIDLTRNDWAASDGARTGDRQVRESSVSAFVPGIGASYEWTPRTTFFAGVHRGFAPPGPGADDDTEVEKSVNYEAGVRLRQPGFGATVTGFYSDYSNILGESTLATGGTGSGDLFNGGAVRVVGLEVALDTDLATHLNFPVGVPVRAAYTFTDATFQSAFESGFGPWGTVEVGDALPYSPQQVASGSVGLSHPRWGVTLAWNAADRMRTEAGQGEIPAGTEVGGYAVFNLSAEWNVDGNASVYAAVQNLTDKRYVVARRPAGVRPALPQTVFVGVRLRR